MANDNNIKNFTASDIEKYHQGLLSPAEMHAIEKAALDDPFLAEALEGYAIAGSNIHEDIAQLKKRLAKKTGGAKVVAMRPGGGSSFPWLRIAVILVLIAGGGLLAYQFLFTASKQQSPIAQAPEKPKAETTAPSSNNTLNNDTSSPPYKVDGNIANNSTRQLADAKQARSGLAYDKSAQDSLTGLLDLSVSQPPVGTTREQNMAKEKSKPDPVAEVAISSKDDTISKGDVAGRRKVEASKEQVADKDGDGVADQIDKAANVAAANNRPAAKLSENYSYYTNINTFRGRVTDNNNNALPFANITNSRDNVGTYSDAQGNFTLVSTDSTLNVQVRSLGFMNKNFQLKNSQAPNKVMLQEDRNLPIDTLDKVKRNIRRNRNNTMTLEEPEPEDGWDSYSSYVMNNLNIPESYVMKGVTEPVDNTVEVSFDVNKNGDPVNIK
jgi:hypothetical protein